MNASGRRLNSHCYSFFSDTSILTVLGSSYRVAVYYLLHGNLSSHLCSIYVLYQLHFLSLFLLNCFFFFLNQHTGHPFEAPHRKRNGTCAQRRVRGTWRWVCGQKKVTRWRAKHRTTSENTASFLLIRKLHDGVTPSACWVKCMGRSWEQCCGAVNTLGRRITLVLFNNRVCKSYELSTSD